MAGSTLKASIFIFETYSTLRFMSYDEAAVEALKAAVPAKGRKWDQAAKHWTIGFAYSKAAAIAVQKVFGVEKVSIKDFRTSKQQSGSKPAAAGKQVAWAESMFAAVPAELHKKVYKALALALHPDTGGDETAMKVLTASFAKVSK